MSVVDFVLAAKIQSDFLIRGFFCHQIRQNRRPGLGGSERMNNAFIEMNIECNTNAFCYVRQSQQTVSYSHPSALPPSYRPPLSAYTADKAQHINDRVTPWIPPDCIGYCILGRLAKSFGRTCVQTSVHTYSETTGNPPSHFLLLYVRNHLSFPTMPLRSPNEAISASNSS